tara:strand:+ start:1029 stop:1175 length:147 start_codon:yes stop_codon:yes gene_type:complete
MEANGLANKRLVLTTLELVNNYDFYNKQAIKQRANSVQVRLICFVIPP